VLVFDPLDGSSNIDVNVSIGTIFGVYRCVDWDRRGRLEDVLQRPRDLVAAGYVLYGSSTMLVYSTGKGVHGFTLDPELGEFLLSHENMTFPEPPTYYSVNHAYYPRWSPEVQEYMRWLQDSANGSSSRMSSRYIGSLVADFHRNLLRGGVFCYPAEKEKPQGKIRLLYEAGPLGFLAREAGGYASTGSGPILDILPFELHQRTPLFIGNRSLVEKAELILKKRKVVSGE
jgi:fructose-1,6-bisphosphatase I